MKTVHYSILHPTPLIFHIILLYLKEIFIIYPQQKSCVNTQMLEV